MATRRPVLHPVHHLSGHLSSPTNFAEFLAFALYLRLYFAGCDCFGLYGSRPGGLGPEFFVGQNRMLGLGFGLLFVLNAGTAGTFLCLQ